MPESASVPAFHVPLPPGPAIEPARTISRRGLLRRTLFAGLSVAGLGATAGLARYATPAIAPFRIGADEIPPPGGEPRLFGAGRLFLINLLPGEGGDERSYRHIAGSATGGLLALFWRCPHYSSRLESMLRWRPDLDYLGRRGWFRCPGCDSTFTRAGVWVFGPAYFSLGSFPLTPLRDGSVDVQTPVHHRGPTPAELLRHPAVDAEQHPLPAPGNAAALFHGPAAGWGARVPFGAREAG